MRLKDIKGYEGLYKVSDMGDVFSASRKGTKKGPGIHKLIPQKGGGGYLQVCLSKNSSLKTFRVHRLVAEAFVENTHGYTEINHIDEDKSNCRADNLEWCTRKYNINYGNRTEKTATKVTMCSKDMVPIRTFKSISEAGRAIGISNASHIGAVLNGKRKTAYGYRWRKAE